MADNRLKIMIVATHLDAFTESSEDKQSNAHRKEQRFCGNILHLIIIFQWKMSYLYWYLHQHQQHLLPGTMKWAVSHCSCFWDMGKYIKKVYRWAILSCCYFRNYTIFIYHFRKFFRKFCPYISVSVDFMKCYHSGFFQNWWKGHEKSKCLHLFRHCVFVQSIHSPVACLVSFERSSSQYLFLVIWPHSFLPITNRNSFYGVNKQRPILATTAELADSLSVIG